MNMEWNKIVTNAISALVVAVFLGAATIVWRGATSVDDKVQTTREDMQYLITSLSEKLATHQVQLGALSNQMAIVINNQSNIITDFGLYEEKKVISKYQSEKADVPYQVIQEKAYSQQIQQQLKR
jgi:hypothetical protein